MLIYLKDRVVSGEYVNEWCKMPYPGHPNGCPNFGKPTCPPNTEPYYELIDPPYYFIVHFFDIKSQVKRIREKHPKWSDRQCRNPLYWQRKQRKILREITEETIKRISFKNARILMRPEKHHVNVFSTCRIHKFKLEKNPQDTIRLISMLGKDKKSLMSWFK